MSNRMEEKTRKQKFSGVFIYFNCLRLKHNKPTT